MRNPLLLTELLREGRNIRLALMVIFYDAIIAFVSIAFLFINAESLSGGYYYSPATYRTQFFMLSLIQLLFVILITPFNVWSYFSTDKENNIPDHFVVIPGFAKNYVLSKMYLIMFVNVLLWISGVPILTLFSVYSGVSWRDIIRLGLMMILFSFWAGAVAIFSFSVSSSGIRAFALHFIIVACFCFGTFMVTETLRALAVAGQNSQIPAGQLSFLFLMILAFNPVTSGMGYYVNITGDNGIANALCNHLGINNSSTLFIFSFYKMAALALILAGIILLTVAVRRKDIHGRQQKNPDDSLIPE